MRTFNFKTLASVFLFLLAASHAHGQIYQWAWVDPGDPTQGVMQSTTLCPGGSGVSAVPSANLSSLDLTPGVYGER